MFANSLDFTYVGPVSYTHLSPEFMEAFRRLRGEGVILQAFTGFIPVFGIPDNRNEVIHVVQGQQDGFQALGILLRIPQQICLLYTSRCV